MSGEVLMEYDVFISHASEDKADIAAPLAQRLQKLGIKVWLDAIELRIGDSLRRSIDNGLLKSKYVVVVLSHAYFNKEWPRRELDALFAKEDARSIVILPILHNISHAGVAEHSLLLAGKVAANTNMGIESISRQIVDVVRRGVTAFDGATGDMTVIGISGASCSGKTWLARKFQALSPNTITTLDLDSYYRERLYVEGLDCKYDNPNAIDFEKAIKDVVLLKAGREVAVPIYDFETHKKAGERVCKPSPLLVIEGLFVFANESFRNEIDIKVWVNAGDVLRHQRRVRRDTQERGRDVLEVLNRYDDDVVPGFERYVKHLQVHADLSLENNGRNSSEVPLAVQLLMSHVHRAKQNT
ncbi:MAG: TIR domain-containing protein [Alphaproteobacteria bacterium]|nr:TIR domain-containing protein [Alphaproteobacteria bacterium]